MSTNKKYTIYFDPRKNAFFHGQPGEYFLTVGLVKTMNIEGYINVAKEENIEAIPRQEVNPYFIELGFFDGIHRNKVNEGLNLTPKMIQFIRQNRPEISSTYDNDEDIRKWFDQFGKSELPWGDITIDDIDKSDITLSNIVSKSQIYPITINN